MRFEMVPQEHGRCSRADATHCWLGAYLHYASLQERQVQAENTEVAMRTQATLGDMRINARDNQRNPRSQAAGTSILDGGPVK
jgi:predicted metalloprotease